MGSNFTCMFLMMIPICSASLMKFGEFWKNVEISWYFKGRHCRHFSVKKLTSLNRLKFHMHVSDDDSNMFCKFDKIWWILKKCWNFIIFLGPALSAFLNEISKLLWMGSNSHACFWWWLQYVLQVWCYWWTLKNVEISWFF